jgi:ribosomal RNA-processing protein 12
MVLAGLAGESSVMKANAIATISILIEIYYNQLSKEFLSELTNIIIIMLKD